MAYSSCSERTKHRWIRERVLDHLNSLEEETASHVELYTQHDVPKPLSVTLVTMKYLMVMKKLYILLFVTWLMMKYWKVVWIYVMKKLIVLNISRI